MVKIRTSRSKAPPAGFDDISEILNEFGDKLKDAQNAPTEGKKKNQLLWDIYRIHHQRSRYVYELYYKKEAITKELYAYLLKKNYADGNLIAKWRKQGYENLCCLRCIQGKENIHEGTCICRVPRKDIKDDKPVECVTCGCRGCASSD